MPVPYIPITLRKTRYFMMHARKFTAALLVALLALVGAVAAEPEFDETAITQALQKLIPGAKPSSIKPSPMKGIAEVIVPPHLFYMSADGKYILNGEIIDIAGNRNITRPKREAAHVAAVDALGEDTMIIFGPKQPKHTVTVFTDIDCTYCRKLHNEIAKYNELGIRIRYLAYPRAGVGSPSYKKAVSVWCAKDRRAAMTRAKQGQAVEEKQCDNPVAAHMTLGGMLGINGTPNLVTEGGKSLPGYVPAAQLLAILENPEQLAR